MIDIVLYPTVRVGGHEVSTSKIGFVRMLIIGYAIVLVQVLPSRHLPAETDPHPDVFWAYRFLEVRQQNK